MYRDRMEVTNSGGLYGRINVDSLGKTHPETRNAVLANILELMKITENRYSGIPTMRKECADSGIPSPEFSVIHGEFKVVLRNGYYSAASKSDTDIISFCSTPRSRAELIAFTGKSRTYTMIKIIAPLVNAGKLRLTFPDKPKSSKQRYIKS